MQGETASAATNSTRRRSNRFNLRNLPDTYSQDDVVSFLTTFGKYSKMELTHSSDKSITVELQYETPEEATEAASKLSKEQVDGKPLKVEFVGVRSTGRNRQENLTRNQNINSGSGHGMGSQSQGINRTGNNDFPLRILVPTEVVGAIIGRKGETIKQITQTSHARIDIHGRENTGQTPEKAITIFGTPENCTAACKEILKIIEQELRSENASTEFVLKILAYNQLCGRLIGKGGVVIKQIMSETNTKITVSRQEWYAPGNVTATDRVITVKGDLDNMAQAESKISERLRACFENDSQAQAPMAPNPALNMFPPPFSLAQSGPNGSLPASFPPNYAAAPGNMQRFPQFPMTQPMQQPPNWYSQPTGPWANANSFQPQAAVPSTAMQNASMGMGGGGPPPPNAVSQGGGQPSGTNGSSGSIQNGSSSQWPPSEVVNLYIPNLAVGAIIGQKGSYIRKIIQLSKASIKVTPLKQTEENAASGDNANNTRERIVTISGTPEAQWNAQFYIFDKIKTEGFCGNDDPRLMTEITVPKSKVGRIIGKGGRKVREIQQLSAAVVKLPEQPSDQGDDVKIQIIGNFYANQTAQRFVRALCSANQLPNSTMPMAGPPPPPTAAGPQSTSAAAYAGGPRGQQAVQQGRMMMSAPHQQQGVVGPLQQQSVNLNGAMPMPPSFGTMLPPGCSSQAHYGPPHYQQQHPGSYQQHHGQGSQYGHSVGHQASYHHPGSGKPPGGNRGNRSYQSKAGLVVPPPGTVLSNNATSTKDKDAAGPNGSGGSGSEAPAAAAAPAAVTTAATTATTTTAPVVNGNVPASENVSNDGESNNNEPASENGGNDSPTGAEESGASKEHKELVPVPTVVPVAVESSN